MAAAAGLCLGPSSSKHFSVLLSMQYSSSFHSIYLQSFPVYRNSQRRVVWYPTLTTVPWDRQPVCSHQHTAGTRAPGSWKSVSWHSWKLHSSQVRDVELAADLRDALLGAQPLRASLAARVLPRVQAAATSSTVCKHSAFQELPTWNTTANVFTSAIIRCKLIKSRFLAQLKCYSINSDVQMIVKLPTV